jgi:hypothetical protein
VALPDSVAVRPDRRERLAAVLVATECLEQEWEGQAEWNHKGSYHFDAATSRATTFRHRGTESHVFFFLVPNTNLNSEIHVNESEALCMFGI